eukprot:6180636-Pleurochrysis_carterae.AAC.1
MPNRARISASAATTFRRTYSATPIPQARHSYTCADIVFDRGFSPCMSIGSDGLAHLDWGEFHDVKPVPFNGRQIVGSSHS